LSHAFAATQASIVGLLLLRPGWSIAWSVLWIAAILLAQMGIGDAVQRPLEIRLEGYLGAPARSVRAMRDVDVQILDGAMRKFAVTNIVVVNGSMLGGDVLAQVTPTKPNFRITGDPVLMKQISDATPEQLLKITGVLGLGDHYLLVSRVEGGQSPAASPTP
jgi:hypothetical protein